MSKGSQRRPSSVPDDVWSDNYRRTFGEKIEPRPEEGMSDAPRGNPRPTDADPQGRDCMTNAHNPEPE